MQIIEILIILADTRDNQSAYLFDLGTSPSTDELAIQFTDTYRIFKLKLENGGDIFLSNGKVLNNLDSINLLFDKMSDIFNNSFWDISSLDCENWNNVRRLAGETLKLMLNPEE